VRVPHYTGDPAGRQAERGLPVFETEVGKDRGVKYVPAKNEVDDKGREIRTKIVKSNASPGFDVR